MNNGCGFLIHVNKLSKDNKGITMINTIVAFSILMLIILFMYQAMTFSFNMMHEAQDNKNIAIEKNKKYITREYKTGDEKVIMPETDVVLSGDDGSIMVKAKLIVPVDKDGKELIQSFE